MNKLKDRLATLNRQFQEIEITSLDGETKETAYYRRPTEYDDSILKKAMNEEYESISKGLKEGDDSTFETLKGLFAESPRAASIEALVASQINELRQASVRELGKPELDETATDEERKAFIEELTPIFERKAQELRDILDKESDDVLPTKAAQARVEAIARDKAFEIYRRRLIAQSLYEKDEETGEYVLSFAVEEVPKFLDTDTINTITTVIIGEMNRVKNLPLRSAATK